MAGNPIGQDPTGRDSDQSIWTVAAERVIASRNLDAEYAGYLVMRPDAARLSSFMYGPGMFKNDDLLATAWLAHTVRYGAERYDRAYVADAQDHRDLRKYVSGRLGSKYFMQACQNVFYGNNTIGQLGLVLNELHPIVGLRIGFFQPPNRDGWPIIRRSSFIHRPSDEVIEARAAIAGFVSRLSYINGVPRKPAPHERAMIRAIGEAEFFWRTSIQDYPGAIIASRNARIASVMFRHTIVNDTTEFVPMVNGDRDRLPIEVSYLIEGAKRCVPAARQWWRSRY